MAPTSPAFAISLSVILALSLHYVDSQVPDSRCSVPQHFIGQYYSYTGGVERDTTIEENTLATNGLNAGCYMEQKVNGTEDATGRYDAKVLWFSNTGCYQCWYMYSRTPNVIQYRSSDCMTISSSTQSQLNAIGKDVFTYVCEDSIRPTQQIDTMFRLSIETVNCKNTFEGVYTFTYELNWSGGSRCTSDRNMIVACQEPGSPYVDNQILNIKFDQCPGVDTSQSQDIRFQCLGTWIDEENGNIWSVMANTGQEERRERFRCMLTREDQQQGDNRMWYSMSRFSQCDTLNSPYDGDYRMVIEPVVYGNQLVEPNCNLPRNFSGTWFATGEFDSEVVINATHVYFKTKLDQYTYRETYFTCQQSIDTRYLMTVVTVGKCEVDYICFDFLPRHHNIIRWRMGKPYRMMPDEYNMPNYLERKFRQACSWNSFTIDRTQTDWTYNIFILNPPSAVDCPVAGRYRFSQTGVESEQYFTRVEGITVRPRHQIDCMEYTSEFKSCFENTKKLHIDVEYCSTVDHTGRPIGEYDIPDNELACVGYWMEDMRSYMITYDDMDAVSPFRCWVYERLDWRVLRMSRSTRSICGRDQTSVSHTPAEGASLALHLIESERIYDDCPTRFNDGRDPYASELEIFILAGSSCTSFSLILTVLTLLVTLILH